MLIISIRFLTGRAHLHPWQNASTQTDIDWPPSPWRFLRALVAVAGRGLTNLPGDPQIAESLANWETGKMLDPAGNPIPEKIPLCRLAELLLKLAQKPPVIWLPQTQIGHVRVFHPDDKGNRSGDRMGSPFLDCFASIDPTTPIYFQWEAVELSDEQKQDLKTLLSRLFYFGRSESWCKAALLSALPKSVKEKETHWQCPCIEEADEDTRKALGKEHVDYEVKRRLAWEGEKADSKGLLLYAGLLNYCTNHDNEHFSKTVKGFDSLSSFTDLYDQKKQKLRNEIKKWLKNLLQKRTNNHDKIRDSFRKWQQAFCHYRKLDRSLTNESSSLTLLRCLLRETGQDRSASAGLPRPIGTRWVHYSVPREVFRVPNASPSKPKPADDFRYNPQSVPDAERVQVVRFALNTNTVHRAVLPNVTATVALAQRIRTVALGHFGRQNGGKLSPQLTGKGMSNTDAPWQLFDQSTDSVTKLNDHATHAHWWLTDEDHDGFLDHLSVLCEKGFSRADVAALQSLVKVRQRDGFPDLLLTPIFVGRLDALSVPGFFQPNAETKSFVSVTPYFCPIHLSHGKSGGGKNRSLVAHIRKELGASGSDATIQEIVFDYDPATLNATPNPRLTAVTLPKDFHRDAQGVLTGVTYHPLEITTFQATLPTSPTTPLGSFYPNPLLKEPDAPCPLGHRSGLYVSNRTRFLPAQRFASHRGSDRTKGPGRMLQISFAEPQAARLFALGKFSHFGLGLFVPAGNEDAKSRRD